MRVDELPPFLRIEQAQELTQLGPFPDLRADPAVAHQRRQGRHPGRAVRPLLADPDGGVAAPRRASTPATVIVPMPPDDQRRAPLSRRAAVPAATRAGSGRGVCTICWSTRAEAAASSSSKRARDRLPTGSGSCRRTRCIAGFVNCSRPACFTRCRNGQRPRFTRRAYRIDLTGTGISVTGNRHADEFTAAGHRRECLRAVGPVAWVLLEELSYARAGDDG